MSGAKRVQILRTCRFDSRTRLGITNFSTNVPVSVKRDRPVGKYVDFRLRMGNDEYGDALCVEGLDEIVHAGCGRFIKSRGRLVHNENPRLACDDARYGNESLLPAGKVEWRTVGKMFNMQQCHGLADMFIHLRFIKPLVARTVGDVLGYGFGEKLTFGCCMT